MSKSLKVSDDIKKKMRLAKAIAVDVDGTLTEENGEINLEAIDMLRIIKRKLGLKIVLASGNAYPVLMGLARYIGVIDLVIAENGGVVGYGPEYKILGRREIGLKAKELIKEKLSYILRESWQNPFRYVDFAFKLKERYSWSEAIRLVEELIKIHVPDAISTFSGVAIHVKDKNVNKGLGLKIASQILNINPNEFIAIGDSDVDVDMMIKAGLSIAVANASKKAIEVADIITLKPYGEGFIEFSKLLLKIRQ